MTTNTNNTTTNLKTFLDTHKSFIQFQACSDYGFDTSDLLLRFIEDFDYTVETIDFPEVFQNYIDENTAISDYDLFKWFCGSNSCYKFMKTLLKIRMERNESISILDVIRTAQRMEMQDAFLISSSPIKKSLIAKYLIEKKNYTDMENKVLETMITYLGQNTMNFDKLFNYALNTCGYDADNCGSKCA